MTGDSNAPLSEQYARAGIDHADKNAAADFLEGTKSAVLAEMMGALGEMPVNRAEAMVKASPEWREFIEKMVEARRLANRAKVRMEYLRMKYGEWNNQQANQRMEAKL